MAARRVVRVRAVDAERELVRRRLAQDDPARGAHPGDDGRVRLRLADPAVAASRRRPARRVHDVLHRDRRAEQRAPVARGAQRVGRARMPAGAVGIEREPGAEVVLLDPRECALDRVVRAQPPRRQLVQHGADPRSTAASQGVDALAGAWSFSVTRPSLCGLSPAAVRARSRG
jgi:hypothetical protein